MNSQDFNEAECRSFAHRMKRFRKAHGLSQTQLAVAMGTNLATVFRIEKCLFHPWPDTVLRFRRVEERYERVVEEEMSELEGLS